MNAEKRRLGYLEGGVSAVVNIALFALKLWVGILAGSVAMMADAWHSLSDTLTSGVVLLGFWVSRRPRDAQHPFGHGRAEVIAASIIGVLLGVVGIGFLRAAYGRLAGAQAAHFSATAIAIFACSFVIKEGLAQFAIRAGKKVSSQALVADGWHHRSDAIASALIVVGACAGSRLWWMDGVMGITVSLLILYATYDVLRTAWGALMGEAPREEFEETIRKVAKSVAPDITNVHHLHVHRYGDHVEVTLHIQLPGQRSLSESHDVASRVESAIRQTLDIEPTVHFEPSPA